MGDSPNNKIYCCQGCKSKAYRVRKGYPEPLFLSKSTTGNQQIKKSALSLEEAREVRKIEIEIQSYSTIVSQHEEIYQNLFQRKLLYESGKLDLGFSYRDKTQPMGLNAWLRSQGKYEFFIDNKSEQKKLAEEHKNYRKFHKKYPYYNAVQNKIYTPLTEAEKRLTDITTEVIKRKSRIDELIGEAVERKNRKSKEMLSSKDILSMDFDVLEFDGEWLELIGKPSKPFYSLVWGDAKAGKSFFALRFGQYLNKFGSVLYVPAEELISHTLKEKIKETKSTDLQFKPTRDIKELDEYLNKHHLKLDFVFIDSATIMNLEPSHLEQLRADYPKISFIVLLQSIKGAKDFKGDQNWRHNVDCIIRIDRDKNTITTSCEGRFGGGTTTHNIS
jgi:hypothetical protein